MPNCFNLAGATFLVLLIASVFSVIGFATPYWFTALNGVFSFGLWESCQTLDGVRRCESYNHYATQHFEQEDWFKAVRSLETIGFILLIVSTILMALYLFLESWRKARVAVNVIFWSFLSGILIIVGVIVLGAKTQNAFHLSWSFALAVVGGILSLCGGILSVFNYKRSFTSGGYSSL